MKEFLNPEPIEMEVQDKDGNKHIFTLRAMTPSDMDSLNEVGESLRNVENKKPGTTLRKQLVLMFGKEEDFYNNFNIKVLNNVMDYVTEQLKASKNQEAK